MDAFLGTIMAVGFDFAPKGWAFCNGQLLPISQNSALFSLLNTTYGGDGQTTFGLPDLSGRVAVGSQGQGPGLAPIARGQKAGTNSVTVIGNGTVSITLTSANVPAHTHEATMSLANVAYATTVNVSNAMSGGGFGPGAAGASVLCGTPPNGPTSAAIYLSPSSGTMTALAATTATTVASGQGSVTVSPNTGGGQPVTAAVQTQAEASIMQPFLGVNYIIAVQGIYPSRP